MKGLTRKIDDLGRLVIPKELRQACHLKEGSALRITCVPAGILLEPLDASCGICGSTEGLVVVDGIAICGAHVAALVEEFESDIKGNSRCLNL